MRSTEQGSSGETNGLGPMRATDSMGLWGHVQKPERGDDSEAEEQSQDHS